MQPNLERPGDELMLQRRRKFDDHVARRTNIAFGDPSPSEQAPTAFHIARKTHAPVGSAPTLDAQHAAAIERGEAAMDQWMTSSQIAQAGGAGGDDDVGKVKVGARPHRAFESNGVSQCINA